MEIKRDWRNENDYEFTNSMSKKKWAWEFLRRNQKYVEEWDEISSHLLELNKIKTEDLDKPDFCIRWASMASLKLSQRLRARRWGLTYGLLNPSQDNPSHLTFKKKRAVVMTNLQCIDKSFNDRLPSEKEKILSGDIDEEIFYASTVFEKIRRKWPIRFFYSKHNVVAFFDLSLPIKPQIERVEINLNKLKKKLVANGSISDIKTKMRKDEWKMYLRLLDAVNNKKSIEEIAKYFFPKVSNVYPDFFRKSRVNERLKQAKKWVNGKYKKLAVT